MNNTFKKIMSTSLAVLSAFSNGIIGDELTASAAEANRCSAFFTFEDNDKRAFSNVSFSLCEDKDGDGIFTRGIDDTSTYKSTSDENGVVFFRNLKTENTYFITQLATNNAIYCDKNIYSFKLKKSEKGKMVDLIDYLPADVYVASYKVKAFFKYKFEFGDEDSGLSGATFAICEDVNGDGIFTRGIDDTVTYKSTSDDNGIVVFDKLSTNKTYFITQTSIPYAQSDIVACDKNVYPLYFGVSNNNIDKFDGYVNILDYLPPRTYVAKINVTGKLLYKTDDDQHISGTTFAICADRDNDGVFTHGIDDLSVMKYTSETDGVVSFDKLTLGQRYFITQISSDERIACNRNVYSFIIPYSYVLNYSEDGRLVLLNDLLPRNAVVARRK